MKKGYLMLLLLFMISGKSYPQVDKLEWDNKRGDNLSSVQVTSFPNRDFEKRIKIKPIEESRNEVEIRFYIHEALTNTSDLKVLALNNGKWKGTLFSESNYPTIKIKKFKLKASHGFDKLYELLLANNLAQLPSQHELRSKMRKVSGPKEWETEHKIEVTDGQGYTVEFKINGNSRIYTFYNPKPYSEFYTEVQELKDYVVITNLFETELKKK